MAIQEEITKRYLDVSGGEKHNLNRFQYKSNELRKSRNVDLSKEIGSATRRSGTEQVGTSIEEGKPVTGLISFSSSNSYDLLGAADNSGSTATTVSYLNYGYNWHDIITDFPSGTKVKAVVYPELDECFVVGYSSAMGRFATTTIIKKDRTATRSQDVVNAPNGKVITKSGDRVLIGNIEYRGKRYPNRVAVSSLPTKTVTLVNGTINSIAWSLRLDDVSYLTPGMVIDIYKGATNTKVVDSLLIVTVDKQNNTITFPMRWITVDDNDRVYLEDQKESFRILWNEDEFIFIPPKENEIPEVTWIDDSNNRTLIWTHSSFWKWDGANLINISPTVGCQAPDSVKKIAGGWILWSDGYNVWAYNDGIGQLQKVSRGMEPYFLASQVPSSTWVASGLDDIYTLYVGPVGDLTARLTSTSTSSTSTSSTSTSTSSTSTSSTSTSSTTTITTTTTSTSTSSTSTSSTTTSTSSTSTSSTTLATGRTTYRLRYYFNLNAWTVDTIDRDVTATTVHTQSGQKLVYWGDQTGRVYRQDVGLTDNGRTVPMELETVRHDDSKPEVLKDFREIFVYTDKGESANLFISLNGGQWIALSQVNDGSSRVKPRDEKFRGQLLSGYDYAIKVTQNDAGEPVVYQGTSCIYTERRLQ